MIKLIASDIDGTLLPEGTRKVNPELYDVIMKLKKKGVVFAAASGRDFPSMKRVFEPIEDDMIFIAQNGAFVTCRGYTMMVKFIEWEDLKELVYDTRRIPGTSFNMETTDTCYCDSKDEDFVKLSTGYGSVITRVDDVLSERRDVTKLSLYHKTDIASIAERLIPVWEERLDCFLAGFVWCDFMKKGVNKGAAVKNIQETLGISPDETMVFGDNQNDISMFRNAAESYAVENASEYVKSAARYVTDTNVNDGVLKVLRTLL